MTVNKLVGADELQLGDICRREHNGDRTIEFDTQLVVNVDATNVYFFRPYAVSSDFSYIGGVIPYIGIENYSDARVPERKYFLLSRKELR